LTSKQRAFLRTRAHSLKPMLQVGNEGVSGAFLRSLAEALQTRELLKVRLLDTAPQDARTAAAAMAERVPDLHVAQVIGRTIVVYRRHPERPELTLPS
jgi:RNA-binding protein